MIIGLGSSGSPARPLMLAALTAWLLTAGIGLYMLRTWTARGGLRRQRATGVGVPPAVVFGHASAALTGLVIWLGFLTTGWDALAWAGVALIAAAIALGISTVTLWTPYPVVPAEVPGGSGREGIPRRPGGSGVPRAGEDTDADFIVTDEMIARLLAEPFPARRRRLKLVPLIPVAHGFAALATFMLAVLAAIGARLGTFPSNWARRRRRGPGRSTPVGRVTRSSGRLGL